MSTDNCTTKRCKSCGVEKPLEEFHKQKDNLYGRRSACRKCRAIERGSNPNCHKPPKPPDIPNGYKLCTECQQILPATSEYFTRHPDGFYGLHSRCTNCRNSIAEKDRRANGINPKNHALVENGFRRCNICLEWKPNCSDYFSPNKKHRGGLSNRCKTCAVKKSVIYQKLNPDKHNEQSRKHRKANKTKYAIYSEARRAKIHKLPNSLTYDEWKRALEYWNGRCAICGQLPDFWHIIAQDHWIPISDSNPNNPGTVLENVLPLCHAIKGANRIGSCNHSKGAKNPIEWLVETLGKRKAKHKLKEIETYFKSVRNQ